MELAAQVRVFAEAPPQPEQHRNNAAIAIKPELDFAWSRHGNLKFAPFYRLDTGDVERSHGDVRELYLRQRWGDITALAGIGRVFWGVTESVHLVDIVNQTDLVENIDGEEKLGQPMVSLSYASPYGTFAVYALPYFRERTFPGDKGRLRGPLPYDQDSALFESAQRRQHLDGALRWSLSSGQLDVGLSHFSGTAREPRFEVSLAPTGPVLTPVYDLIEQSALDFNLVQGGWIWKLEALRQQNRIENYSAAVGGFEYTFASVFDTGWDAGVLTELLWDGRGENAPTPYQKDVFVGARLAANDVAGLELLAGGSFDLDRRSIFASLEGSRRIGSAGKLSMELRFFTGHAADDPLSVLRSEDYLQIEYTRYF